MERAMSGLSKSERDQLIELLKKVGTTAEKQLTNNNEKPTLKEGMKP